MSEIILVIMFIIARVLLYFVERICSYMDFNSLSTVIYVVLGVVIGTPFFMLLTEGWLEKVGMKRTAGVVIILGIIIIYWVIIMGRFITKSQSNNLK